MRGEWTLLTSTLRVFFVLFSLTYILMQTIMFIASVCVHNLIVTSGFRKPTLEEFRNGGKYERKKSVLPSKINFHFIIIMYIFNLSLKKVKDNGYLCLSWNHLQRQKYLCLWPLVIKLKIWSHFGDKYCKQPQKKAWQRTIGLYVKLHVLLLLLSRN